MVLLIVFAFLAGVVTILSPCILPILPIILSSSVDSSGKRRPFGVVTGFVVSFTFFTLFLSTIVKFSGIPAESLRYLSIVLLILFGLSLFVPGLQLFVETILSKLTSHVPHGKKRDGFAGGILVGLSLGLLWTPCVGPILASVISLALSGSVNSQAVLITVAYSLGTAIPMFIIMQSGATALKNVPWLLKNTANIQKIFGFVMVITATGIFFNIDRQFQTFIITKFPQYGTGLTALEDNDLVKNAITRITQQPVNSSLLGKPMPENSQPKGPLASEIIPGGEWFNTPGGSALTVAELKGKVVLIDFWTYSCINCQRTLPYLRQWWEKYKNNGLMIIGVHAPEFEFEKNAKNVQQAIHDFSITYPVVQDNNFATWRAYNNRYWPAKYLIDKDGYVRYTHFGEGEYDATEKVIQQLLKEAGENVNTQVNNPKYSIYSATPETYLGYARIDNFASPERIVPDTSMTYTLPKNLASNHVAFSGTWEIMEEYANPQPGAGLSFNFESREVFLVMKPKKTTARVRVYVDNTMQYFGEDTIDGTVTVNADRLYRIISLPSPGKHILRLEFPDGEVELFAFTFG